MNKLHLGCGENVLNGWTNIDVGNNPSILRLDLTEDLPMESDTVEFIYSEHFIEHIRRDQAEKLFIECFRVLKPDGVIRISTPDLRKLINEYLLGRMSEWYDVGWAPETLCQMVNEGITAWGHQFLYDYDELKSMLEKVGFLDIIRVSWRESKYQDLCNLECRPSHGEIIIEAHK